MSVTENLSTPVEIDTALAELHVTAQKLRSNLDGNSHTLLGMAGAEYHYRGRKRVTDMKLTDAIEAIAQRLANPTDEYQLGLGRGFCTMDDARKALAKRDAIFAEIAANDAAIHQLSAKYTGWSRFFVVTSSPGHIHSSMYCSTCYDTTTYGWLPNLSGQTEAEAVAFGGSNLCTVCFPSAPSDYVGGKLSQADAEKLAKGEKLVTAEEKRAIKAEAKRQKELAKVPRAEALAHKVNELFDAFDTDTSAAYRATYPGERFGKGYDNAYSAYSDTVEGR